MSELEHSGRKSALAGRNCPPEMKSPCATTMMSAGAVATSVSERSAKAVARTLRCQGLYRARLAQGPYGGAGLSRPKPRFSARKWPRINARSPLNSFGIWMLGPALLKFGTEEQKVHYLPDRARRNPLVPGLFGTGLGFGPRFAADLWRRQGRPLGRQRLRKSGRAMPTRPTGSSALSAPTRKNKYQGISFLLFDMTTPGVSTKPILLISANSPFCETFFDNVERCPSTRSSANSTAAGMSPNILLGHEREMISGMGGDGGSTRSARLSRMCWPDDPCCAPNWRCSMSKPAFRAHGRTFMDEWKTGKAHPAYSNLMKYVGTELNKRATNW
jgi:acyl-CoA dehydrogenase